MIEKRAEARVAEIRPIALCFHAKHPLTGLPTVADLTADETSGPRGAAVSEAKDTKTIEIQAAVALTPAAVAADVEAAPVVNRGHIGGRSCLDGHIRGRRGRSHPKSNQSDCRQQKLLHHSIPNCYALREATVSGSAGALSHSGGKIGAILREACIIKATLTHQTSGA